MHSKEAAPSLLRISMSLVFFYFSFSQLKDPSTWAGYVPKFLIIGGISANNLVVINGFVELLFGLFLITGLYTRISSLILGLHLFGIALSIGFSPVGIRDFGLALATLTIFLFGPDRYTLDSKFEKKKENIN
jgi:uncharacterized membrane protein YphA (DoxX/SURF4 family)